MLKKCLIPVFVSLLLCLPCRAAWDSDAVSQSAAEIRSLLRREEVASVSPLQPLSGEELGDMLAQSGCDEAVAPSVSEVNRLTLCRTLQACSEEAGLSVIRYHAERSSFFAGDTSWDDYPLFLKMEQLGIISPDADGYLYGSDPVCRAEGAAAVVRYFSLPTAGVVKFNEPVSSRPEGEPRDPSALYDCCLIGHSHAVGMKLALGLEGMDVMAVNGMSAVGALSSSDFPLPDGSYGSLFDGLRMRSYRTVFLLLGTNDMPGGAWNLPNYIASMRAIIDTVKVCQPEARIILLSIAPVGAMYAEGRPDVPTEVIPAYNRALKSLSRDCSVDYLDTYTVLADENDLIRAEYGNGVDGLHFNPAGYQAMLDIMLGAL